MISRLWRWRAAPRWFAAGVCACLFAGLLQTTGCEREFVVDELSLSDEAVPIVKALTEEPVFALQQPPAIKAVSRVEMEDALYGEMLLTVKALGMEGQRAESLAREQSRGISRELGVKFFSDRNAVLVVTENVTKAALELTGSTDEVREFLRGRLLAECSHAVTLQRYGAGRLDGDSPDMDFRMARTAVVEGFARFLARRLAVRNDWMRSFDLNSLRMVPARPETIRTAQDAMADQAYRRLAFIHLTGERFVTAVFEQGGEPAIAKLFQAPPDDPDLISRPEWYLDPSLRPQPTRELERALSLFAERYDQEDVWQVERLDETHERIAAQLASCDEQDRKRMLDGIVTGRVAVASNRASPGTRHVVLQIKEHTSAEEASFFVRKVQEILQEDRTGNLETFLDDGGRWSGFRFDDSTTDSGAPSVTGCVVACGVLTISPSFTGESVEEPELRELVSLIVDAIP